MASELPFDVIIVGAGIVGTATGMRLVQRFGGLSVAVLEKEPKAAFHQTGHNSGVLHSGIYYRPGSLKAGLCVDGLRHMVRFAQEHQIPHRICGKLIVATSQEELPGLEQLWQNGLQNGITDLELCDWSRLKEIEPHVAGLRGIYSPGTGVIDFAKAVDAMTAIIQKAGGRVLVNQKVKAVVREGSLLRLVTPTAEYRTKTLVNCGGLHGDILLRQMGISSDVRIIPFRGEYYKVRKESQPLVQNLIYPVPDPRFPFLGVHFTRTIEGMLKAGPNAVLALSREGYRKTDFNIRETIDFLTYGGFWRMTGKYWRMGFAESYRSWSKAAFLKALQRLVPEVTSKDLLPGPTGVRAQCVSESGELINDFKIIEGPHCLHVLNVPSPAATASLAIADYLIERYLQRV